MNELIAAYNKLRANDPELETGEEIVAATVATVAELDPAEVGYLRSALELRITTLGRLAALPEEAKRAMRYRRMIAERRLKLAAIA